MLYGYYLQSLVECFALRESNNEHFFCAVISHIAGAFREKECTPKNENFERYNWLFNAWDVDLGSR